MGLLNNFTNAVTGLIPGLKGYQSMQARPGTPGYAGPTIPTPANNLTPEAQNRAAQLPISRGGSIPNAGYNGNQPYVQATNTPKPVTAVKPKSATDGLTGPNKTLPKQFQAKSTGTQAGDLSKGLISNAPLQSSTQGGTNASLIPNDGSNIKAPEGMSYDGQGKLVPTSTQPTTNTGTTATASNTQDTSYGGLISQLANRGQSDSPEVQKAREALTKSQLDESQTLGFNSKPANGGGVSYDTGSGNDALQRALYGNEQNALSSQLSSAVSTQGQQIGALDNAAGLAAPTAFGLSMDPVTGQPINMSAMQIPLQTALGLYKAGTPLNDPSYAQALGPIGSAGWMAFYNALQNGGANGMSGGINPAAQSATQSQAISQGVDSQGQAYNLDTGLKQLKTLSPVISNFMAQSNINSTDSPLYNAQIGTYLSQVGNPGQWNQFQNMMGELRKFQSQLLASGAGGIPTDVSNTINSTDISKLSLKDIRTAMETMDILGSNQTAVLQGQGSASLGGHLGYSGSPASVHTSVTPATPSTAFGGQVTNPVAQGAIGAGLNFGPELLKWGSGIWTAIKTFGK